MRLALALAVFLIAPSVSPLDQQSPELVNSGVTDGLHWPSFARVQPDVARFYELNSHQVAWVHAGAVTPQGRAMVAILQNAGLKGLDPNDYDGWRWNLASAGPQRFDLALTVSVIRYIHDLSSGKIDPAVFDFGLKFKQPKPDLAEAAHALIHSQDVPAALNRLEPPYEGYWRTEKALDEYLAQGQDPHRIRQLQLVLERWRWVPHSFARPPIVVNIPEFRLRAYDAGYRPELEMKVVVGKAYHHKTPVFSGEMTHLIFRPYWDVPYSIQRAELVPKIAKDSNYLAMNDYEVVDSRRHVVSRDVVTAEMLDQLRSGKLFIRQVPGDKNALGHVKFLFPNEYNVYLHGTPARALFQRTRRDFSHGCIRVEKPEELAVWVLRRVAGWDMDRIRAAEQGPDSTRVNLDAPIPVLIVYGTAVVSTDGVVHFFDDIYGYDAELERLLDHGYPYSDWQAGSNRPRTSAAPVQRPHE